MSLLPPGRMRVGLSELGRNFSAFPLGLFFWISLLSEPFGSTVSFSFGFLKPLPASFAKNCWVQIAFQTSLSAETALVSCSSSTTGLHGLQDSSRAILSS